MKLQKTVSMKTEEALQSRKWLLIDAEGVVLGRLAADVAAILRGKHKPCYTPHVDCGDHVVIINADKIRLTGGKEEKKMRYHHTGYPGGIKGEPYGKLLEKDPERALKAAVKGMLPHNVLGRQMIRKMKVYAGSEHPHAGQEPIPYTLPHIKSSENTGE